MTESIDIQRIGWDAFLSELPGLLAEAPGKWVAFRGKAKVALGNSKQEVYSQLKKAGYPLDQVLVRRIEPLGPPIDLRPFKKVQTN